MTKLLALFSLLCIGCSTVPDRPLVDAGIGGEVDAGFVADASEVDAAEPIGCKAEGTFDDDVVVTRFGAVRGVSDGPDTLLFRGVPYAAPPIGALRWKAPVEPACFDGVFDAAAFGPRCPQLEGGAPIGDESCLVLNVWKPRAASAADALPVLFFIHGGGNAQGSAIEEVAGELLYDGRALSEEHQVVVVTIQYRLGPLGWLMHADLDAESEHGVSGNYGALDQIRAMSWVKENIAAFGGDPGRVMIFGESAGARNVCVLVASPLAAGLFSAALMESGACIVPPTSDVAAEGAEQVRRSGCESASGGEIACLRAKSAGQLLLDYPPIVDVAGKSGALQPHIDDHLLFDQPNQILSEGRHNHVPFIIGANSDETSRTAPNIQTEQEYEDLVIATLGPVLGARALAVYPVSDYASPRAAYVAITSDSKFICNARRDARAADLGQEEPVFRYFYTRPLSAPAVRPFGAFHGAELFYVFDRLSIGGVSAPVEDQAFADLIGGYWTRLAATGDPNGDGAPRWEPYDGALDDTLVLGMTAEMISGIRTVQCDFWDSL